MAIFHSHCKRTNDKACSLIISIMIKCIRVPSLGYNSPLHCGHNVMSQYVTNVLGGSMLSSHKQ